MESATAKDRKSDRVDFFQRKEFEGKTDEVAKRTLQYLKTKVKRMTNEKLRLKKMKAMMMKLTTKAMKANTQFTTTERVD